MFWAFEYSTDELECANNILAESDLPSRAAQDPVVATKVIHFKGASSNAENDYVIDICDFDYFTH